MHTYVWKCVEMCCRWSNLLLHILKCIAFAATATFNIKHLKPLIKESDFVYQHLNGCMSYVCARVWARNRIRAASRHKRATSTSSPRQPSKLQSSSALLSFLTAIAWKWGRGRHMHTYTQRCEYAFARLHSQSHYDTGVSIAFINYKNTVTYKRRKGVATTASGSDSSKLHATWLLHINIDTFNYLCLG